MKKYNPATIPGVVFIAHDLYTKSPESLTCLVDYLTNTGYRVKDVSQGTSEEPKPPRQVQEREGRALWYADLDEKVFPKKGECDACKTLGEVEEMIKPNYRCKGCGQPTVSKGREEVHFQMVKLFDGKRYNCLGFDFPLPEIISIYEAWHWAPLKPGQDLYKRILRAAGQVAEKDFYYQDGSPAFDKIIFQWMFDFIDNFTTLSSKALKPELLKNLSGPGFIDNLARLTGHEGFIPTEPNIGNALMFFGKALNGEPVTQAEIDEGIKGAGLDDPNNFLGRTLGDDVVKETIEKFSGPTPFQEVHQARKAKRKRF